MLPLEPPILSSIQSWLNWAWPIVLGHPAATVGYGLNVLIRAPIAVAIVSLVEYPVHRYLMHDSKIARWARSERLKESSKDHLLHHFMWYRCFNDEPDPDGKLFNLHISGASFLVFFVIAVSLTAAIDPLTGILTMLAGVAYLFVFNAVHEEMHLARDRWYTKNWLFEYWELSHFLHHVNPSKNFNVLIPWVDPFFGTKMKPTSTDRETMKYAKRMLRLRNRLRASNLSGYVVSATDRGLAWLSGFSGEGCCIVLNNHAAIFTDCSQADEFRQSTRGGYVVSPHKNHPLLEIHGSADPTRNAAAWLGARLADQERLGCCGWGPKLEPIWLTIASKGGQFVVDETIDLSIENALCSGQKREYAQPCR
jgi:hypothetical protein